MRSGASAPPAVAAPAIARVEGRTITQADFDRIATPYYAQLHATMGAKFTADVQRTAALNVLDELVRREVLALEARRQGIQVSQAETDSILARDPFFLTNGAFDSAKFNLFKSGPTSNYGQLLPGLRDAAAAGSLDHILRQRFTPSRAAVRAEWTRRNEQVRCRYFQLQPSQITLEPEASAAECQAYYAAHPDEFESRARMRFRYFRLPLPVAADSSRANVQAETMARGSRIADSLRAGTIADTASRMLDTGLFDVPFTSIPGLGGPDELLAAIENADTARGATVLGPYTGTDAVVVGAVTERRPRELRPMRDVIAEVTRRADDAKRRAIELAAPREFYDSHPDRYRGTRAVVRRVTLDATAISTRAPAATEVERWYREHGHRLFGQPDSSRAWMPPLSDSLRTRVRVRIEAEDHEQALRHALGGLSADLAAAGTDPRTAGVARETLTLWTGLTSDSLFTAAFRDSLLATAPAQKGVPQGPRRFGRDWVAWQIEAADTAILPPFELVRARAAQDVADERRQRDDDAGRAYFAAHRGDFKTPVRYQVDYVTLPIPPPDSVVVPEADVRAEYAKNRANLDQPEQVRPRILFLSTRGATPAAEQRLRARADSLLTAVRAGADFAELARRFSDDMGTVNAGGDLGWRSRGQYTQAIETVAFGLQPGGIGPVVRTPLGYTLVKLEDRRAARVRTLEEVRPEIRARLALLLADSTTLRAARALVRRMATGRDLYHAAAPYGGIQRSQPFAATEPLSDLGVLRGWDDDHQRPAVGTWARQPLRADHAYVVLRVTQVLPSHPAEFEEARFRAVQQARDSELRRRYDDKVAHLRAALRAGAALDSLAAPYGGLRDSGPISQSFGYVSGLGFEPHLVQSAFALKAGETSDTLQVANGIAWVRLEDRTTPDARAFDAAVGPLTQELLQKSYNDWLEAKKQALRIEVLRPDLQRPHPGSARQSRMAGGG